MLTKEIVDALKGYTANMKNDVTLVLQTGEHAKRTELTEFLSQVTSVSDRLHLEERDTAGTQFAGLASTSFHGSRDIK